MSRLFDDEFLRAAARLRILAQQVPPGGPRAEQRSPDRGTGLEFRDFRSYVPGDDLRRVDWNAYRRSGRLFLRLFNEPETLAVHVFVDVSQSMFLEDPPRADAACQLAGLITAIAMGQADRVTLWPFGAQLGRPWNVRGGQVGIHAAFKYLEELEPAGETDFAAVFQALHAHPRRRGLIVVISDFFDAHGIDAILEAMRPVQDRLVLAQLVRASDADPKHQGEVTLVDCETQAETELQITPDVLQRYKASYRSFCERLLRHAAQRRAMHARIDADIPVLSQIEQLFTLGVLGV